MVSAPVPISNIDTTPAKSYFANVKNALSKHNYTETVNLATNAVVNIQQLQLMAVLDHRAYALGMRSKFEAAMEDAKEMITYAPEMAAGYLRLGSLLAMQGKQGMAIEIYQEALEKVASGDIKYEQLVQGKKIAEVNKKRRVDFFAALPPELGDEIIMLMEDKDMAICLNVSTTWRRKIANCGLAWVNISNEDDTAHGIIASALPYIARYIEDLIINTDDSEVWFRYLDHMEQGQFKKIESFEMTNIATTKLINTNMIMSLTSVLWQMRTTLTRLQFTFHSHNIPVTLTDLLFYCTNLQCLVFEAWDPLDIIVGDLELLGGPHQSLIDLETTITTTTSESLEPLLKQLPKLRRLSVSYSTADVLDLVYRMCPNLEIFGYNPSFGILDLDDLEGESSGPGLRAIYTRNGGYGVPKEKFLPFLLKNMHTLQTIYANLSLTEDQVKNDEPYHDPFPDYRDLKLERAESLTFWPDKSGIIQTLVLHAIESCKSLTHIAAVATPNIPSLVDTLITMPPLEEMELSHIGAEDGGPSLVRLFKMYASLPESKQKFRRFWFRYCSSITDEVLDAVADGKAIKEVTLTKLGKVTQEGLWGFMNKLRDSNVFEVKLVEMDVVNDVVLEKIGGVKCLKTIILEKITDITDDGIKRMVDDATNLRSLTLDKCKSLSKETVSYVQRKIRYVEIIE
ncbi:hypothetical protein BDA99DRAFT_513927 [Phascolomyces articulosus]|uniref:F-box domain-containing protein n=1 Tax=Phascolomyces articulosus TaxID=60185 RepID=A0AAD5JY33_9FUNG|nr:hypothetical protein BDA99DRAFT_513927 [Phascolomyces articulosus]